MESKSILKNFFSLTFSNIIGQVITFLTTIYLARIFGPEEFGTINFAQVFVSYFILFSTLGLPNLGIIKITKNENKLEQYVNKILSLRGLLSTLSFIVMVIVVFFFIESTEVKIMILINGVTVLTTGFFIDWVFQALQQMKYVAFANLLRNVSYGLLLVPTIVFKLYTKIYIVPFALALSSILGVIYLLYIYLVKHKNKLSFDFSVSESKKMITDGVPFFFSGIFAAFNNNIDILMIGLLRDNTEVGLYSAVYKFINIITVFISFIFTPLYPYLIKYYHEQNWDSLSTIVNKLTKFVYILAFPILAGSLALRNDFVLMAYGEDYLTGDVQIVFIVLMIHVTLLFIREIYGYELTAWGLQKKYMKIIMVSSGVNILANLIFIPMFGFKAAAFATLLSEVINIIFMKKISHAAAPIKTEKDFLWKIILISVLMGGSVYLLRTYVITNMLLLILIGMVIYGGLLLALGVITKSELKQLKGVR